MPALTQSELSTNKAFGTERHFCHFVKKYILPAILVLTAGLSFWAGVHLRQGPPSSQRGMNENAAEIQERMRAVSSTRKEKYRARCEFELLDERIDDSKLRVENRPPDPQWLQTQLGIITSSECMKRAVEALKLDERWKLFPMDAAKKLSEAVEVGLRTNTSIVTVAGYSDGRLEAAELANAVMDAYEIFRNEMVDEQGRRLIQNTEALIKREQAAIEKLEADPKDGKELAVRKGELERFLNLSVHQKLEHQVLFKPIRCLERATPPSQK